MTLPVVWLAEADADLKEALAWYESIHPDLGVRFALAVDAAVEFIARSPLAVQIVHAEIRRAGVRRFPYGLFFKVINGGAIIDHETPDKRRFVAVEK